MMTCGSCGRRCAAVWSGQRYCCRSCASEAKGGRPRNMMMWEWVRSLRRSGMTLKAIAATVNRSIAWVGKIVLKMTAEDKL